MDKKEENGNEMKENGMTEKPKKMPPPLPENIIGAQDSSSRLVGASIKKERDKIWPIVTHIVAFVVGIATTVGVFLSSNLLQDSNQASNKPKPGQKAPPGRGGGPAPVPPVNPPVLNPGGGQPALPRNIKDVNSAIKQTVGDYPPNFKTLERLAKIKINLMKLNNKGLQKLIQDKLTGQEFKLFFKKEDLRRGLVGLPAEVIPQIKDLNKDASKLFDKKGKINGSLVKKTIKYFDSLYDIITREVRLDGRDHFPDTRKGYQKHLPEVITVREALNELSLRQFQQQNDPQKKGR